MDPIAAIKKVPTPVLIGLGGATIGIGYALYRARGSSGSVQDAASVDPSAVEATPVADQYSASDGGYVSQVPSGVAYVGAQAGGEDASSTVGAVGQTALDTVAGIATAAIGVLAKQPAQVDPDLIAAIAASRVAPTATMPMPQPPPPATPARPVALTKAKLRAGYHAGNSVGEAKFKKVWPGAIGWVRVASGGKGKGHWIDYHIQFSNNKIQRWRYTPAAASKWRKVWP